MANAATNISHLFDGNITLPELYKVIKTKLETRKKLHSAMQELEAYSDRELADLNISRADIAFAAKYGYTESA